MSDLQIVKEEPTEPSHSHSPNPKSIPNPTSTNTNTLSLIPPLPSNIPHTNSSTAPPPPPPPHNQSNPFGPTHYTHASPPFSTYYPHGPPIPPGPPPMPFQAPPFPNTDVTTHNRYTPATHPMFYPPVFHYNQPPPPPSHYNDNNDASSSSNHGTPQPTQQNTNNNNNNNNLKKHENINNNNNKTGAKPYSFTPGMQPGAYYLIPLQTANGQVDNVHNAYMPLINSEKNNNNNNNNKNDSDISSSTSDSDSSDSSDNDDTNRHNNNHNNNQPLFAAQPPFLNAQIPHLPLPIPLTPNGNNNGQFPPPPIPLPYTDINQNLNNNTQFSLQPILNNHNVNGNMNVNEKNNGNERNRNEDKKNIIKRKNNAALQTSFMMQQPTNINNINPNQSTQPLSFPPLPTNNSMTQSNNINHLNSNFAGTDLSENIEGAPERGDSSDQDMDVALGRNINNIMPIIQQNNENTNTNNNSYYHITPFQEDKNKKKLKNKRNKSPKKSIKKIRKHSNKKKVSTKIPPNAYQAISVPALNKMNVSSHKLAHKATTNGRRITRKKNKTTKKQKINDIPDLSDHENNDNTNNSTKTKKKSKKNASIAIPPPINDEVVEGQMEVAYSQQYPQVGFPYIYNSEADNGKKFTCKFMDSALSMVDGEPQFCDRLFGQKCHWMRHCLEKHVPTEMSQRYQCRYCNMKYAQNSSLKEHVAICHSNKPPSFKCPYCSGDITFTRWTSVLRHCRNQHPDQDEPKKIKSSIRRNNNMHNNNMHNNNNNNRKRKRSNNRKKNTNNNGRVRRNHNNNNNNNGHVMDIDSHGNLSTMNIMPSVNMNISMNQMLSSNNYIIPANVAILPPDLSHHNGRIR